MSRPLALKYGAVRATALAMLLGCAMLVPLGVLCLGAFRPAAIPAQAWIGAAYLGVVASVVMYLLWVHALGLKEPSRVAIAANGQPILTALGGWLFFAQPVTSPFLAGAALVIAGVLLTQL
jgi:drug/metabolite transporter (DMT)-like permease